VKARLCRVLGAGTAALLLCPGLARGEAGAGKANADAPSPIEPTIVRIAPQRQTLTLGTDSGTTLSVTISGPLGAQATPGRTQASVGSVGPLVPQATLGSFAAEYRVPPDRFPQSAIVTVEVILPGGSRVHGSTHLLLPAATDFPLRTSPSASVSLQIAGRLFGPRKADGDGNVRIPIVVPPGVATGLARAVNRFGVTKQTHVSLQLQDYARVLLIAPPDAEAGSTVGVQVLAVQPSGDLAPPEDMDLRASSGKVQRIGGDAGAAEFTFTLPTKVGPGAVALVASMDDGTSARPDAVIIRAGPLVAITMASDVARLVIASQAWAHVTLVAVDRFGNVVSPRGMTATANAQPLPIEITSGGARAKLAAPGAWSGQDHIRIEAHLDEVKSTLNVPLTGGDAARLALTPSTVRIDGNGRNSVDVLLEVFDARGIPTSAHRVAWRTEDDAHVESLPAPRFGTYAIRVLPRRALRDRSAVVAAAVDANLAASTRINIQAAVTRTAAARVGLASNLGSSFGLAAFLEGTLPLTGLGRLGRLLSAGLSLGYLHSEVTTSPAGAAFPAVHLEISQAPILALARVRLPAELPVEISLSGSAGMTFAATAISPIGESHFGVSRGSAHALVIGAGADASVLLQPGELMVGARYLHSELGHNSNGDQIEGNSLGLVCDLGFRIGF
jgi:hypothetical protein